MAYDYSLTIDVEELEIFYEGEVLFMCSDLQAEIEFEGGNPDEARWRVSDVSIVKVTHVIEPNKFFYISRTAVKSLKKHPLYAEIVKEIIKTCKDDIEDEIVERSGLSYHTPRDAEEASVIGCGEWRAA